MTRRTAVTLLPVLAVAAMTLVVARRQPEWALADSTGALSVEIAAGLALAVAGAVVMSRGPDRRSGALLCGAAAAWLIAEWDNAGAPGGIVFTLGMALGVTAPALLAHALLVHGSGRLGTTPARLAVAATDAERRRLERDLHDGAQQVLAALAMAIGVARGAAEGEHAERMAHAQNHVRAALDGVRALAYATYPAALDEAGLAAALDVLSDWQANVELGALPEGRLDPALEASADFIVAALTRTDGDAMVDVNIHHEPAQLVIDVRAGAPPELTEVEDRVGALSGQLAVNQTPAGDTHVQVGLPCA